MDDEDEYGSTPLILLHVVYTERNERTRIISARRSTRFERML